MVNYTYRMLGCGENILHGAKLTLFLTTLSMVIGVLLGTVLALGKISKNKFISKICSAYIFFFRGTPLMIQLFVVYYTLPAVFGFAWRDLFSAADTLQVVAQPGLNPTIASLIMSSEAVFGTLAGWIILHQTLTAREILGCLLMFIAIVIAQLPLSDRKKEMAPT